MMSMRGGCCIVVFWEECNVDSSIASMDFSAFLCTGMAKEESKKVRLRPVDEGCEVGDMRVIRLSLDGVEEVVKDQGEAKILRKRVEASVPRNVEEKVKMRAAEPGLELLMDRPAPVFDELEAKPSVGKSRGLGLLIVIVILFGAAIGWVLIVF
jgi:hypothetical protein